MTDNYVRLRARSDHPERVITHKEYIFDLGEHPVRPENKARFRETYPTTRPEYNDHAFTMKIDGKDKHLGYHATEEEAARAHDAEGARLGRELNFPEEWKDVEDIEEKYEALSYKKGKRKASSSTSKYRGVSLSKCSKSKPWKAVIRIDGKMKYLGSYATEEETARAYDAEGARHGRELNFPDEL